MKKNIFVALAAAVVLLFSSCSKDIDLAGTTWKSNTINKTVTMYGMSGTLAFDMTINFTDATNYTGTQTATVTISGQTFSDSDSDSGTYTFDGENGMFDGEQPFTYNKKDKTITVVLTIDDAEAQEILGSDPITLTFTQQK